MNIQRIASDHWRLEFARWYNGIVSRSDLEAMSLLVATQLGKAYGALDVFDEVDLRIEAGDRIGFVGSNGAGKTTLLRILAGVEAASAGAIHRKRGLTLGYLPQDPPPPGQATLYGAMLGVFERLQAQGDALATLEHEFSDRRPDTGPFEENAERYRELLAAYGRPRPSTRSPVATPTRRIAQVLGAWGSTKMHTESPHAFQRRGANPSIAGSTLLQEPDPLLLDEPTNHLDLEAVEWLEETSLALARRRWWSWPMTGIS
jgi:ATP-binding cassette subfamily F protein 3